MFIEIKRHTQKQRERERKEEQKREKDTENSIWGGGGGGRLQGEKENERKKNNRKQARKTEETVSARTHDCAQTRERRHTKILVYTFAYIDTTFVYSFDHIDTHLYKLTSIHTFIQKHKDTYK